MTQGLIAKVLCELQISGGVGDVLLSYSESLGEQLTALRLRHLSNMLFDADTRLAQLDPTGSTASGSDIYCEQKRRIASNVSPSVISSWAS